MSTTWRPLMVREIEILNESIEAQGRLYILGHKVVTITELAIKGAALDHEDGTVTLNIPVLGEFRHRDPYTLRPLPEYNSGVDISRA